MDSLTALYLSSEANILFLKVLEAERISHVSIHHPVLAVCVHVSLILYLNLEEVLEVLFSLVLAVVLWHLKVGNVDRGDRHDVALP